MKTINYILAVTLVVFWVIGFFNHIGGFSIHLLFVAALILILINIIRYENINYQEEPES